MQITLTRKHVHYAVAAVLIASVGWVAGFIAAEGFWTAEAAGWAQVVGTLVAIWASTLVALSVRRSETDEALLNAREYARTAADFAMMDLSVTAAFTERDLQGSDKVALRTQYEALRTTRQRLWQAISPAIGNHVAQAMLFTIAAALDHASEGLTPGRGAYPGNYFVEQFRIAVGSYNHVAAELGWPSLDYQEMLDTARSQVGTLMEDVAKAANE